MLPLVCVFALMIAPAFLGSNANEYYYGSGKLYGTDTRLGSDIAEIEKVFGMSDSYVLMVPRGDTATE